MRCTFSSSYFSLFHHSQQRLHNLSMVLNRWVIRFLKPSILPHYATYSDWCSDSEITTSNPLLCHQLTSSPHSLQPHTSSQFFNLSILLLYWQTHWFQRDIQMVVHHNRSSRVPKLNCFYWDISIPIYQYIYRLYIKLTNRKLKNWAKLVWKCLLPQLKKESSKYYPMSYNLEKNTYSKGVDGCLSLHLARSWTGRITLE